MNFRSAKYFFAFAAILLLFALLLICFPPSRPLAVAAAVCSASAIAFWAYSRCCGCSSAGAWLLLGCIALVGSGVIVNSWFFTTASGGSDSCPALQNFDAALNWSYYSGLNDASMHTDGWSGFHYERHTGYPMLMRLLSLPFGPSLAFVLGVNMLAVLLTIILCGSICRLSLSGSHHATTATTVCGLAIAAANCYFMVTGTIFIKDALIQCFFAAFVYHLLKISDCHRDCPPRYMAGILVLILLIAVVRHLLLPLLLPGIVLILWHRHQGRAMAILLTAAVAIYVLIMLLPTHEPYAAKYSLLYGPYDGDIDDDNPGSREAMLFAITGDLNYQMPWIRALWLPATMLCQFLIPFPWNFSRDMIFGPSEFYAHIAYPGYLCGIFLGYYILWLWRRGPAPVNRLLLYGIMLYAVVAYMYNGAVSRYCLTFIPLAAPAICFCLLSSWRRRSLWIWTAACALCMAAGLTVCHHLTQHLC